MFFYEIYRMKKSREKLSRNEIFACISLNLLDGLKRRHVHTNRKLQLHKYLEIQENRKKKNNKNIHSIYMLIKIQQYIS
jgi:hypothetical protein